jgi:preprotein translocase subunit SecD
MLNKYPWWKNLLIIVVIAVGILYALPNLFAPDPAIQISGESGNDALGQAQLERVGSALETAGIDYFGETVSDGRALIRLRDKELQLRAKSVTQKALGDGYVVALNLAPTTPEWLTSIGAEPMKLGLDLSGGVHFLLEVDTQSAIKNRLETYTDDFKKALREQRVRGIVTLEGGQIVGNFASEALMNQAADIMREDFPTLQRQKEERGGQWVLTAAPAASELKQIGDDAVSQNLTTLRNRVNEIGVAEPIVQKQGNNRIIVQLPGIQDTAAAKRILGKTASLEFRLEARPDEPAREKFEFRDKQQSSSTAWLEKRIVISGQSVSNARASFDENGMPEVNISLDSQGGTLMHRATRDNINRKLGVLFIERKARTVGYEKDSFGHEVPIKEKYDVKEIISLATIRAALGTQFRITGLDSPTEAAELALLLRAGALAAPVDFVEERTVGPSLGAENIAKGYRSVQIGMAVVLIFMLLYYRVFGLVADIALLINLGLLLACMSILSATLTLPGIAGIVLTVGMAVDANVLIFSRIREELKNGLSPQQAIKAGFDRAFVTILDANITTLIVAVILYAVGTGSVKGFAVTLSIGILTSMFTAIVVSRGIINLVYGGSKNVKKLWI